MDNQRVELFQDENIDIFRYQRDYPKITKLKDSYTQASPGSIYGGFNSYDQLYNDIIVYFRQNGEADTMLQQIIASKDRICRHPPFTRSFSLFKSWRRLFHEYHALTTHQRSFWSITLERSFREERSGLLQTIAFPTRPSFQVVEEVTERARRRLEAYFKLYLHNQALLDLPDRVRLVDEMFNDLLSTTLLLPNYNDQYTKYKVDNVLLGFVSLWQVYDRTVRDIKTQDYQDLSVCHSFRHPSSFSLDD